MDTENRIERKTHHGRTIKRLRQTLGIKQETLAVEMGLSQGSISFYEQKKEIENEMLEKFAHALDIPVELIKETEIDPLTVIFENHSTIESNTGNTSIGNFIQEDNSTHTYNPIDKIVELYERLLEVEKEKVALVEKLLIEKDQIINILKQSK